MTKQSRGPRPKHVPQRTCIACRKVAGKRGLVRLVRTAEGNVEVDPSGKQAGRGAYLHPAAVMLGNWVEGQSDRAGAAHQADAGQSASPSGVCAIVAGGRSRGEDAAGAESQAGAASSRRNRMTRNSMGPMMLGDTLGFQVDDHDGR